jgi:hypothetical protein
MKKKNQNGQRLNGVVVAKKAARLNKISGTPEKLRPNEKKNLVKCERIVRRGISTFFDVAEALWTIREQRLYRETHNDFASYCSERWGFGSRRKGDRLAAYGGVLENLRPTGLRLPTRESQVRSLVSLPREQQRRAWKKATKRAGNGVPTAKHVWCVARKTAGMTEQLDGDAKKLTEAEALRAAQRVSEYLISNVKRTTSRRQKIWLPVLFPITKVYTRLFVGQ